VTAGAIGSDPAELLDLATRLARESGRLLVEASRHRLDRLALVDTARRKSSTTDLATEADRASEQLIVGAIKKARPTDAVLGEEGSEHGGTSGLTWIIDPIDGTTNFVYDFGTWAVSIGVADGDGSLAGAVFDPLRDEMFTAVRGAGASAPSTRWPSTSPSSGPASATPPRTAVTRRACSRLCSPGCATSAGPEPPRSTCATWERGG
jgi:fructose-1,6-bisphosphatase/inositol monophosphatase family enzyme